VTVPFVNLRQMYLAQKDELDAALGRVLDSGRYVLGPEVTTFEEEFAGYCGASHCVGVANGLDALHLSLRACGIGAGDEVIVPSNTYIATWLAVSLVGATPVPVEPDPATHNLDPERVPAAIGARTRALLVVHLYGRPQRMQPILELARQHGLRVVEDVAQAVAARDAGRVVGTVGDAGAFSFYPTKNLGAFGDGGAVLTNDDDIADAVRRLRNYGESAKYVNPVRGFNSRLDELQAALLRIRLPALDGWNAQRRRLAASYRNQLEGIPGVVAPGEPEDGQHVWHQFVVRHLERNALREHLLEHGVQTLIHYPQPPHLQDAYRDLGYSRGSFPIAEGLADQVLSLPIGTHLDESGAATVVDAIRSFAGGGVGARGRAAPRS
jgi:dTDP-4-amino-4,6-dideoxygalactose transaminase